MGIKILMTTMSFDIGGAETHILELSKELVRRGNSVTVASNGGVYVSALEECGITHIKLPLHRKNIFSVIKSTLGLARLIRREKYEVVHAHARIPAFICGLLSKFLKFRFVTTAHGIYDMTPYWRLFSDWGEKSLAVSCDVKQYLIEEYGICSDNISVTINGIDTEKFKKSNKDDPLGLAESTHRIIHVSRIDTEAAHTAFALTDAAELLYPEYPDLSLVIVGEGTAFNELSKKASEVNASLGREVVSLAGGRTDIDRILGLGDIFVGVSRAALEAMSAELPVILAGAQGFLGEFTESTLSAALETNFCCRGYDRADGKMLANEIKKVFSLSEAERKERGIYNRKTVVENYSVSRMGEDAVSLYRSLTPYRRYRHGDILLSGYYGFENTGDDSLLQAIVENQRKLDPNVKITVLSKTPRLTAKRYAVRSINRFNIPAVILAMRHAKLLVNGGGSLIQNTTSTRSLWYYLSVMRLAKALGLSMMLYAGGIGPLFGEKNKKMSRDVLDITDVITLRENSSKTEVMELGVSNKNVSVSADPAFLIKPADEDWVRFIINREGIKGKFFAVSLRGWKDTAPELSRKITKVCLYIKENYGYTPVFIPMQGKKDAEICSETANKCGGILTQGLTASELCGLLSHAELVIGMRLHLLIYSAVAGTPCAGISYDPKIDAVLDALEMPYKAEVERFDPDELCKIADTLISNRETISAQLLQKAENMRNAALSDAETVKRLLK